MNRTARIFLAALLAFACTGQSFAQDSGFDTQGKFLVADRSLRDPNFVETVVLMLAHDETGAMGLVINRPSDVEPREILADIDDIDQYDGHVFVGGPVRLNFLMFLIRSEKRPDEADTVFDDVHAGGDLKLLEDLARSGTGKSGFRIYVGHAGWGPGQLEAELKRKDWHVLPASGHIVFSDEPDTVWEKLIPAETPMNVRLDPNIGVGL